MFTIGTLDDKQSIINVSNELQTKLYLVGLSRKLNFKGFQLSFIVMLLCHIFPNTSTCCLDIHYKSFLFIIHTLFIKFVLKLLPLMHLEIKQRHNLGNVSRNSSQFDYYLMSFIACLILSLWGFELVYIYVIIIHITYAFHFKHSKQKIGTCN